MKSLKISDVTMKIAVLVERRLQWVCNVPVLGLAMHLTVPYPDSLPASLGMSRSEFEQEARLLLAARLFAERKISSGLAAEMAGISRIEFLTKTAAMNLSAAMPSADEIAEDVGA